MSVSTFAQQDHILRNGHVCFQQLVTEFLTTLIKHKNISLMMIATAAVAELSGQLGMQYMVSFIYA